MQPYNTMVLLTLLYRVHVHVQVGCSPRRRKAHSLASQLFEEMWQNTKRECNWEGIDCSSKQWCCIVNCSIKEFDTRVGFTEICNACGQLVQKSRSHKEICWPLLSNQSYAGYQGGVGDHRVGQCREGSWANKIRIAAIP